MYQAFRATGQAVSLKWLEMAKNAIRQNKTAWSGVGPRIHFMHFRASVHLKDAIKCAFFNHSRQS